MLELFCLIEVEQRNGKHHESLKGKQTTPPVIISTILFRSPCSKSPLSRSRRIPEQLLEPLPPETTVGLSTTSIMSPPSWTIIISGTYQYRLKLPLIARPSCHLSLFQLTFNSFLGFFVILKDRTGRFVQIMVRFSLVTSLFAAAASAVNIDTINIAKKTTYSRLPGAYIFEFEDDNVRLFSPSPIRSIKLIHPLRTAPTSSLKLLPRAQPVCSTTTSYSKVPRSSSMMSKMQTIWLRVWLSYPPLNRCGP